MNSFESFTNNFLNLFNIDLVLTIIVIAFYFIVMRTIKKLIKKVGTKRHMTKAQRVKFVRIARLFLGIFSILILTLIWGLNIKDIWVFSSVVLGFVGVAIFALWSILSNVIAAYIIFFSEPFQIGDTILLKDGSDSLKGEIIGMTTFYIKLRLDDGGIGIIPNNLTFLKTVIKYPMNP